MEIIGNIINILPKQTGTGKNGQWEKQEFILETLDQFPQKVCIGLWGEKTNVLGSQFTVGSRVKVSINIESREYTGKWYTNVRAWNISNANNMEQKPAKTEAVSNIADASKDELPPFLSEEEPFDTLPF
ncbi:MAG: DUF3127 domain-containing protein [Bacteroidales bacterium]|nr:DUF3127 domain-containing protein [Bacteroidales bacterium]